MYATPRRAAPLAVTLLLLLSSWLGVGVGRVRAQACHGMSLVERTDERRPFRATFGLLAASYDHGGGRRGSYQGLHAGLAFRQPWWAVEVSLPAYRLAERDDTRLGVGDLTVGASGTFVRAYHDHVTMGVAIPVMLPTGDVRKSLGMGHVMPMPQLWFRLDVEPFAMQVEAGYARALGRLDHHEHSHDEQGEDWGQTPIVNPMNRAELTHALTLELGLQRHLRAHARWFGALPVEYEGRTRQILGGGATLSFYAVEFTTELQAPVYGTPFDMKLLFQLAALF